MKLIARTSQPPLNTPFIINRANPITNGLIVVDIPKSGTPTSRGIGGIISNVFSISDSDKLVGSGTLLALVYYPPTNTAAGYSNIMNMSSLVSFPSNFDQAGVFYDSTPPARDFVSRANSSTVFNVSRPAPTNEFRLTVHRYKAGVSGDGGSIYETGQTLYNPVPQYGALGNWVTGRARQMDSGNAGGPYSLLHAVWARTLSDSEIKSLENNPWQLFASPRRTVWNLIGAGSNYFQTLSDTVTMSDTFIKAPQKVLLETVTSTDTFVKIISRALSDVVTMSDTLFKRAAKVFTESTTITDAAVSLIKVTTKALSETVTITDTFIRSVSRVFTETITSTDTFVKKLARSFVETVTMSDILTKIISRTFAETVTITDAAVNAIKVTAKALSDTVTMSDTLVRSIGKVLVETITNTDTLFKKTFRSFAESITMSDTFSRLLSRILTETVTITDAAVQALKVTAKVLTETITLTDLYVKRIGKLLSETVTISDTLTKAFSRALNEVVTMVDTIAVATSKFKSFTETVTLTDILTTVTGVIGTIARAGKTVLVTAVKGIVLSTRNVKQSAIRAIREAIVIKSNNK